MVGCIVLRRPFVVALGLVVLCGVLGGAHDVHQANKGDYALQPQPPSKEQVGATAGDIPADSVVADSFGNRQPMRFTEDMLKQRGIWGKIKKFIFGKKKKKKKQKKRQQRKRKPKKKKRKQQRRKQQKRKKGGKKKQKQKKRQLKKARKLDPNFFKLSMPEMCPDKCNRRGVCMIDFVHLHTSGLVKQYDYRCHCHPMWTGTACQTPVDHLIQWYESGGVAKFPHCCNVCPSQFANPIDYKDLPVFQNPYSSLGCDPTISIDSKPTNGKPPCWRPLTYQQYREYSKQDKAAADAANKAKPAAPAGGAKLLEVSADNEPTGQSEHDAMDIAATPAQPDDAIPADAAVPDEADMPRFQQDQQKFFGGLINKIKSVVNKVKSHWKRFKKRVLSFKMVYGGNKARERANRERQIARLLEKREFEERKARLAYNITSCCVFCDFDFWQEANALPKHPWPKARGVHFLWTLQRQLIKERHAVKAMHREMRRREMIREHKERESREGPKTLDAETPSNQASKPTGKALLQLEEHLAVHSQLKARVMSLSADEVEQELQHSQQEWVRLRVQRRLLERVDEFHSLLEVQSDTANAPAPAPAKPSVPAQVKPKDDNAPEPVRDPFNWDVNSDFGPSTWGDPKLRWKRLKETKEQRDDRMNKRWEMRAEERALRENLRHRRLNPKYDTNPGNKRDSKDAGPGVCCSVCPIPADLPQTVKQNWNANWTTPPDVNDIARKEHARRVQQAIEQQKNPNLAFGHYLWGRQRQFKRTSPCCAYCPSQFWLKTIVRDLGPFDGPSKILEARTVPKIDQGAPEPVPGQGQLAKTGDTVNPQNPTGADQADPNKAGATADEINSQKG